MKKKGGLSDWFNRTADRTKRIGAGIVLGAGAAAVGAAVLPFVAVSLPVVAVGAAVGAVVGYRIE